MSYGAARGSDRGDRRAPAWRNRAPTADRLRSWRRRDRASAQDPAAARRPSGRLRDRASRAHKGGEWMAALLAAREDGTLSHRTAAAIWEMMPSELLEVTSPAQRRPRRGFRLHCSTLPSDEITTVRGIPVTTVPRTLLDLARSSSQAQARTGVSRSRGKPPDRSSFIAGPAGPLSGPGGHAGDQGIARKGRRAHAQRARSPLSRLHRRIRAPRPELNAWLQIRGEWLECDCLWRRKRLIAELTGAPSTTPAPPSSATAPATAPVRGRLAGHPRHLAPIATRCK